MAPYAFPVGLLHSQLLAGVSRRTDFGPFEEAGGRDVPDDR